MDLIVGSWGYTGAVIFGATVFSRGRAPLFLQVPPDSYQGAPQFFKCLWPAAVFLTAPTQGIFQGAPHLHIEPASLS